MSFFFLTIDGIEEETFSICDTDGINGLTWKEVSDCIVSQYNNLFLLWLGIFFCCLFVGGPNFFLFELNMKKVKMHLSKLPSLKFKSWTDSTLCTLLNLLCGNISFFAGNLWRQAAWITYSHHNRGRILWLWYWQWWNRNLGRVWIYPEGVRLCLCLVILTTASHFDQTFQEAFFIDC